MARTLAAEAIVLVFLVLGARVRAAAVGVQAFAAKKYFSALGAPADLVMANALREKQYFLAFVVFVAVDTGVLALAAAQLGLDEAVEA